MTASDNKADEISISSSSKLEATVAAFQGASFVLMDGGLFDDLPNLFRRKRLFARSLYLDRADAEVQKAGPWLVALDQAADAKAKVMAMSATKPFAVFWCCPAGEAVLHRHLRTLNMARIPDWAARGASAPPADYAVDVHKTVFFRHYDPRVLGALLPTLDAPQFSRFLGPAAEVAFEAAEQGGLKRVIADPAWPSAPVGLLTVTTPQCLMLADRRIYAAHQRIRAYLQRYAPVHSSRFTSDCLLSNVQRYHGEAEAFGVRNENAIALWSYMQITSHADLSRDGLVLRYMSDPACGATPDARMQALFDLRTRLIKKVYG